jgi:predicted nucleic acid-binding protein
MRVVLDSNVLVAGLRSRNGASYQLLRWLRAEKFEIALSVPLAFEYEAVLVEHAAILGLERAEAVNLPRRLPLPDRASTGDPLSLAACPHGRRR